MCDGIDKESDQSNDGQRDENIENCFPQSEINNEGFHVCAIIAGIVFNIKHDTKDSDEHEIFDEQEATDFIWLKRNIMHNIIIEYRVNVDEPGPGKSNNKWFQPTDFPDIITTVYEI